MSYLREGCELWVAKQGNVANKLVADVSEKWSIFRLFSDETKRNSCTILTKIST